MKKTLLALLLALPFLSRAQSAGDDTTLYIYYKFTYGNALDRYWAKKVLLIPRDTTFSKDGLALKGSSLYLGNGVSWSQVTGGGGGGSDSGFSVLFSNLGGVPISKFTDGLGRRFILFDTTAPNAGAILTRGSGQKKIDSLKAVIDILLSGKQNSGSYLTSISTVNTVTGNGTPASPIQLINDASAPGNSLYYGTNGSGAKGYYSLPAGVAAANPTTSIGLTTVNGTASTFLRSDAAQALSQAIVPTWTGVHTFSLAPIFSTLTGYLKGNGASAVTALSTIPATDLSGTLAAAQEPAHTGDVTNTAGSLVTTIPANTVTNAKSAQMGATTIKANVTGSTANATDATPAAVAAILPTFTSSAKGLVPPPGGSPTGANVLADNGAWIPAGSGGTTQSVLNPRKDTFNLLGGNPIPVDPNPHNTGWYNLHVLNNNISIFGSIYDSIDFSGARDSLQASFCYLGNSLEEHPNLTERAFLSIMYARYPALAAGPGIISMGNNRANITVTAPGTTWTTRNAFTSPVGRGIDTYEAISNVGGSDSMSIVIATPQRIFQYNQSTEVDVCYYDGVGGSFVTHVDGAPFGGTVNTTGSAGPKILRIYGLPQQAHQVTILPTGTVSILWVREVLNGRAGWIYNKIAKGASMVSHWTALNSAEWQTQLNWLKPTYVSMNWVVTSMTSMDTAAYVTGVDTMVRRVRVGNPKADIALMGSTPYSYAVYGNPPSPAIAYDRSIKRFCYDNKCAFWSSYMIYGDTSNLRQDVSNGIISAVDSLHPTAAGAIAEMSQKLSAWGMFTAIPRTYNTIYNNDDTVVAPAGFREVYMNGAKITNGTALRLNDASKFIVKGTTGNPTYTIDNTNPLLLGISTNTLQEVHDGDIKTSQIFSSSYSGSAKTPFTAVMGNVNGIGGLDLSGGGGSTTSSTVVFVHVNAGTLLHQFENTNSGTGHNFVISKADGTGGIPAFRIQSATGIWDLIADPADSKKLKLYAGNSLSTGTMVFTVNPTTFNTNFGSATDVPTSLFSITSTTKGSIPIPSMTTTQKNAISTPAEGLWAYDNVLHAPYYWNGSAWTTPGGMTNPMTTAGDIIVGGASGAPARLAIGSNGTFPVVSSGALAYTTALPSGTTATTQTANDNSTKVSTTAYADNAVGNKFTATASASTITNTTVSTTVVGTGVGSLTLPANSLQVGQIITLQGAVNVSSYASGNISFGGVIGGNTSGALIVVSSGAFSNMGVYVTIRFTVTAIGSSGSVSPVVTLLGGGDWGPTQPVVVLGSAITVNTTGTLALDAVGAFSVASASNSMNGVPGWRVTVN